MAKQQSNDVHLSASITIAKQTKSTAESVQTKFHHNMSNVSRGDSSPLSGIVRTFKTLNEDDVESERRPDESTLITLKVEDELSTLRTALVDYYDIVATQETGNTMVKADVVIDGAALIANVPVGLLLFLERKMDDLRLVFSNLPTLPLNEKWGRDDNDPTVYTTDESQTRVTKKVPRNHVKASATDKHPAQVEVYYEDVAVGYWHTVKTSGAISVQRKNELLSNVDKLRKAVKTAREEANANRVPRVHVGDEIFTFLLGADSEG